MTIVTKLLQDFIDATKKQLASLTTRVTTAEAMIASQTSAVRTIPPPPPPIVAGPPAWVPHDVVLLGDQPGDGPTTFFQSDGLGKQDQTLPGTLRGMQWTNQPMGDYLDASGVLNGTNHYASTTYPSIGPWNVTTIVQKMMVDGNTGFHLMSTTNSPQVAGRTSVTPPVLNITTTTGSFSPPCTISCWTDVTTNHTLNEITNGYIRINNSASGAAFLKFNLTGVTGTVTSATLSVTVTNTPLPQNYVCKVNYLKMPALIWEPARQLGGVVQGIAAAGANDLALASHPSVIFYPSFANQAACEAAGWTNLTFNGNPHVGSSFVSWSQWGLTALRMVSTTISPHILSWIRFLGGSHTELYCRYLMKIDPDVYGGMTEIGVKLPGLDSSFGTDTSHTGDFSYRMEHTNQSPSNVQAYGYFQHAYDATHSIANFPSDAQNRPMNPPTCFVAGKIYCIEQRVKLNTDDGAGNYNSDGIFQVWIDGVLMMSDTTRKIRSDQVPIVDFHANFYHGGTGAPLSLMHYEFGAVCVATQYIGPPKTVIPAWLVGVAVNQWVEIPGTKLSDCAAAHPAWDATTPSPGVRGATGSGSIFSAWCGLSCDTRDSTLWGLANGGHSDYYGNQAVKLKLSVDAPVWEEAAPPSDGSQVVFDSKLYADGRPASAHSYDGQQFIEARNRAMRFGSHALPQNAITGADNIVSFNPATGLYEADGTYPDCPIPTSADDSIAKDPATEDVYIWPFVAANGTRLVRWNQATNTWTLVIAGGSTIGGLPAAIDSRRNRMFFVNFFFSPGAVQKPGTVDLGVVPGVVTQQTYSGGTLPYGNGCSIVFVPHPTDATQDCFLFRKRGDSGGTVWRINAATFFVDTLTTTGGSAIPADVGGGPYNRFLMTGLNGIAYAPNSNANVWFLRTS